MRVFLIVVFSLITSHKVFCQLNIQTGYDIGFYDFSFNGEYLLSDKKVSHFLHRTNVKLEYKFKNNFFIGLKTGLDFHDYHHELVYIREGNDYAEMHDISKHESVIRNSNIGLSIGYIYHFNQVSSLFLMINYDQFFINNVKNTESSYVEKYYSISETEGKYLAARSEKYATMIDLEDIGYYEKLNLENRHVIFSIGYRYQFNDVFMSSSIKYSPFNRSLFGTGFITPDGNQNIFLFGLKIGYTFSKKPDEHEK